MEKSDSANQKKQSHSWKAFTNIPRNKAIYDLENIINKYGYILDFKYFSDMQIALIIEIEQRKITELHRKLDDYLTIVAYTNEISDSKNEEIIKLNVTFTSGIGDLEHIIPSVPG